MWSVVYKSAINPDGSLLFPERLTKEFLEQARRTMGSFLFAGQYLNQVVPDDEKSFRPEWLRYFKHLPEISNRFAFIDPAIGQNKHHDYTGIAVVDVDMQGTWYVRQASRHRYTPTQIVDKMFDLVAEYDLKGLGVEIVAYQEALLYMLDQEMTRRGKILPVKGIQRQKINKQTRILGLVPRFEWGRILISQGMTDFEDEYASFPRASHDDILDALSSLEDLAFNPVKEQEKPLERPNSHHHPDFERWAIQEYVRRQQSESY